MQRIDKTNPNVEPTIPRVDAKNIPTPLKEQNRWLVWKWDWQDGKGWTKPPVWTNGLPFNHKDRKKHRSFDEVLEHHKNSKGKYGVGFSLADSCGFIGIDLDNCIRADGTLTEVARDIVDSLDTYTEYSPSGAGLRLFLKGDFDKTKYRTKKAGVEVYTDQYLTLTGQHFEREKPIADREISFDLMMDRYLAKGKKAPSQSAKIAETPQADIDQEKAKELAIKKGLRVENESAGNDGSSYLVRLLCRCILAGCDKDTSIEAIEEIVEKTEADTTEIDVWVERNYQDVFERNKADFGSWLREPQVVLANYEEIPVEKKTAQKPLPLECILDQLDRLELDLVNYSGELFLIEGRKYEQLTQSALLAVIQEKGLVRWNPSFLPKAEFYEGVKRRAPKVERIELTPHFPPIPGFRYLVDVQPAQTGKLDELLDILKPASDVDRCLLKAAILTMSWGGPPGKRPGFSILPASEGEVEGIGSGKTTACLMIARPQLLGGVGFYEATADERVFETLTKHIVTPNKETNRMILIDNFKGKLEGRDLEKFMTLPMISGHQMYKGQGKADNFFIWLANGNGITFGPDLTLRLFPIRIERPEYDPNFDAKIRDFDWLACMQDIAFAFSKTPAKMNGKHSRFSEWDVEVLARCAKDPDAVLAQLRIRQSELSGDKTDKEAVIDALESYVNVCNGLGMTKNGSLTLTSSDIQSIFDTAKVWHRYKTQTDRTRTIKRWGNLDGRLDPHPDTSKRGFYLYLPPKSNKSSTETVKSNNSSTGKKSEMEFSNN